LVLSWLVPIAASFTALAVTLALRAAGAHDSFFFLFIPAVMIAAWHGGQSAGLVATLTSLLLIVFFLLEPHWSVWVTDPGDALLLTLFGAVCVSIGLLTAGRRRAEDERERALHDAEHARHDAEISSRLKDQFLATLSHELRTPLNAVLGWTRMLANGQVDPEKIPAALASIERNAHAQKQLVDDLLDVSAIVSGRLRLTPREMSLDEVVRGAVDSVRLSLEGRHQRLEQHLEPVQMVGDADRLQQVMWNLLTNAVKFTPDGGEIALRLERLGASARITVRDSGRGIRPEFLPHVFEPFRQADASITRTSGGLGLGLALVRHLVEAHGGSVSAASDGPKRGSTFVVTLPQRGVTSDAKLPTYGPVDDAAAAAEASSEANAEANTEANAEANASSFR
jgi:signal transduction histidine kinase